jgi:hypothetical protein
LLTIGIIEALSEVSHSYRGVWAAPQAELPVEQPEGARDHIPSRRQVNAKRRINST